MKKLSVQRKATHGGKYWTVARKGVTRIIRLERNLHIFNAMRAGRDATERASQAGLDIKAYIASACRRKTLPECSIYSSLPGTYAEHSPGTEKYLQRTYYSRVIECATAVTKYRLVQSLNKIDTVF